MYLASRWKHFGFAIWFSVVCNLRSLFATNSDGLQQIELQESVKNEAYNCSFADKQFTSKTVLDKNHGSEEPVFLIMGGQKSTVVL